MTEKYEFCSNSHRWLMFMMTKPAPESCPWRQEQFMRCSSCGYYQMREANNYIKRKIRVIDKIFEDWNKAMEARK